MMKGKLRGGVGIWEKKNRPQNPWSLRFAATRWWALRAPTRTAHDTSVHEQAGACWLRLRTQKAFRVQANCEEIRSMLYETEETINRPLTWIRTNHLRCFPTLWKEMEVTHSHLIQRSCYIFTWLGKVSQSCKLLPYRNYEESLIHYTLGWNVPTCFRISSYPQFM